MDLCLIENNLLPLARASLPMTDLLIQRGIAIFEAFICPNGKPLAWEAHLERFKTSAELLHLSIPKTDREIAQDVLKGLEAMGNCEEPLVRFYLTGGDAAGEQSFDNPRMFYFFLQHEPWPQEYHTQTGLAVYTLDQERFWPKAKTINYSQPLTKLFHRRPNSEILYCPNGQVTECHSSTFFIVKDQKLITAPLDRVLLGTTRQLVITVANELGLEVEERTPDLNLLHSADEAFQASTSKKVMPITSIDDHPVANGKPGPITTQLYQAYIKNLPRFCTDLKQKLNEDR